MQHEQDSEDLIGAALRRAYRVEVRKDERFDDLVRRLLRKEQSAPNERRGLIAAGARR